MGVQVRFRYLVLSQWLNSQVHHNLVAFFSLAIAVSGFMYGMWREERSESNRNVRTASFQVLMEVEQLRLIVDYAHYNKDLKRGDPITGWPHVLLIRDLSHIINPDVAGSADNLYKIWSANWDNIDSSQDSVDNITSAIEEVRGQDLKILRTLK